MSAPDGLTRFSIADIVDTPLYYPLALDSVQDRVLLRRMSEADYRVSSFLDDRIVMPGMRATWVPHAEIAIAARHVKPRPLHFIFHSGHVGSTLLSRLLDELPGVLGLREPSPLRTLADDYDRLGLGRVEQFNTRLATFLNLWSRGFKDTRAVIVKSTSIASRIAPAVLGMAAKSRAIYLNVTLDVYLASMLASQVAQSDISIFAELRSTRLAAMLGEPVPPAQNRGETFAIAWLTERFNQHVTQSAGGDRVLAVDFDDMLANLPQTLAAITAHLELKAGSAVIAKLARSPALSRYSKAPERLAFSSADRAASLAKASRDHAAEIAQAKAFLGEIAKRHEIVATLLQGAR